MGWQEQARRAKYPETYGTPECPNAGIRPRTPRYGKWRDHRSMELLHEKWRRANGGPASGEGRG